MAKRLRLSVWSATALLFVAGAFIRIALLPLPAGVRAAEALVCVVVITFLAASYQLTRLGAAGGALVVLYALTPALVVSVGLRLVAADLPDYTMFAALVFAALLLGTDVRAPIVPSMLASVAVLVVFVELWLDTVSAVSAEVGSLAIAVVLLAGLRLLLITHSMQGVDLRPAQPN
ncbi:MAG: hypothetical protein ABR498_09825, partial [Candidatus Dormibacteria bacterium]